MTEKQISNRVGILIDFSRTWKRRVKIEDDAKYVSVLFPTAEGV
jgi:hypothetical protein